MFLLLFVCFSHLVADLSLESDNTPQCCDVSFVLFCSWNMKDPEPMVFILHVPTVLSAFLSVATNHVL